MHGSASAALAVAIVLTTALLAAGCGGGDEAANPSGPGVQLAAPINLADCSDWKDGSVEERLGTISAIRDFTGGAVQGTRGTGSVLDDERAYELFESYCENEFARGFKLYKLYGRAAAFSGAAAGEQAP